MTASLQILDFESGLAADFDRINREWITGMFFLEEVDEQVISDPETHIIAPGGHIWFAQLPGKGIVGTCALAKKADGVFELTKMGVSASARGHKVGEALLQHVLAQAPSIATRQLFLLTNSRCEAAIHLYEKNGFVHDADVLATYGHGYQRCDVAMRYAVAE
ncbi:GNAT family N-acetyltransferase [Alteromonas halophila]|uniref:N-acetyltransferase domain-containing protein n=1 Tax=Alteromonas halophila TaxID=516698 RepID=A0A918MZW6_9ALTE|nr:GNAT family N-acetyltransferase [Alteromonas halophila]GGW91231.1 hypothetical protein GCM10007391_26940 [Alteromonas halophila]